MNNKIFEVALRQYQADGSTGLAFGGTSIEESVVASADILIVPDASRAVDQVVFTLTSAKPQDGQTGAAPAPLQSKALPFVGRGQAYRHTFDRLPEGDYHWQVKLAGREKDPKGGFKDAEWTFPASRTDFSVRRGVTEPIALALAGPYLFAFEAVSVLLLAALVGAAFLARKEVKEA